MPPDANTARELGIIVARLDEIDRQAQERAAKIAALNKKVDQLLDVFKQGSGAAKLAAVLFAIASAVGGWAVTSWRGH